MWRFYQSRNQCDDGSEIQYDGCFSCLVCCDIFCAVCQLRGCEYYQTGYKKIDQQFILIVEMRDDGNSLMNDGCKICIIDQGYKCQTLDQKIFVFNTILNVQILSQKMINQFVYNVVKATLLVLVNVQNVLNVVQNAKIALIIKIAKMQQKLGNYNDFSQKKCTAIFGDGIMAGKEECDDGNNLNQDRCNQRCEVEVGFLVCFKHLYQK
ncbi:unnamed protein product (macronuclear) [Paramecium tetraurelia]|uniref:Uncharacterized protein n=1 Tax=Paramecium tetraurelia TaxID=5888 RepID=A0CUT5_PARTE|nr:uncharacterized protein GSPATT00039004001 [Paramecium tetraurelia]CAK74552.1 unnamed protein product [Paramecium tetraurelia]|eukprot:XP_001441949.1 hypothetical protein (macronuclear) [Paramecium tetraurelia strain d4-2]